MLGSSTVRTLAQNTFYLGLSNVVQYGLTFLTGIVVGRALGVEALGIYGLASAVGQIAYRIADLGVPTILTRHFARSVPERDPQFRTAVAFRLWTGLLLVGGVEGFALLAGYGLEVQLALIIYTASQLVAGLKETASSIYYGHEAMGRPAMASAIFRIVAFVLTVGFIVVGLGVVWAVAALLFGQIAAHLYLLMGPEPLARSLPVRFRASTLKDILKDSYPLAFFGLFGVMNSRIDTVLLSLYVDNTSLGLYNAAYSILIGLTLFPNSFFPALYPALSRSFDKSKAAAVKLFVSSQALTAAIGIAIALFVVFLSRPLIVLLYGPEFAEASNALSILSWGVFLIYMSFANTTFFNAVDRQHYNLWMSIVAATVNIGANLVLIPRLGIVGAAWATVLSEGAFMLTTELLALRLALTMRDGEPSAVRRS